MQDTRDKLRKHTGDPEGDFPNGLLFADGGAKIAYYLPFEHRKLKPDGTFTKKTYTTQVLIKYNPFTGEPLDGSEKAKDNGNT